MAVGTETPHLTIARRKGRLRGKQPKLPESAQRTIRQRYAVGDVSIADLANPPNFSSLLRGPRWVGQRPA